MAPKCISDLTAIEAESSYSPRSNNELLSVHPRVCTKTTLDAIEPSVRLPRNYGTRFLSPTVVVFCGFWDNDFFWVEL